MKNVLLKFTGPASQRDEAELLLRERFPGLMVTRHVGEGIEAELDDSLVSRLAALSNWSVTPIVFADINPPALRLDRLRAKLAQRR